MEYIDVVNVQGEFSFDIVRELNAVELVLVGGGMGSVLFDDD